MVTPQQEVGEGVCCHAWTDTMADIIINYSWHLSLPRGLEGQCQGALESRSLGLLVGLRRRAQHKSNPRDRMVRKSLESHSRSCRPAWGQAGHFTAHHQIRKAAGQPEQQPDHREVEIEATMQSADFQLARCSPIMEKERTPLCTFLDKLKVP